MNIFKLIFKPRKRRKTRTGKLPVAIKPLMSTNKNICPLCGGRYLKAIYRGLPLRICESDKCGGAQGPALWLMERFPVVSEAEEENGWALFTYEGSYWRGLWDYLWS